MEVRYSMQASRAMRRCDKRKLVDEKIRQLAVDPLALSANVIRLKNREDYRLRVQNWRVLFEFQDGQIFVKDVLPRGDAYED